MVSLIYSNPLIYRFVMRCLYGAHHEAKHAKIAELIPKNSSVLELCAGDFYLYTNYLKNKKIKYVGSDISPVFLNHAKSKGINCIYLDVMKDKLPKTDIIIMQSSLYQFMPNEKEVVEKMLKSCNKKVIISENVRNLSDSKNPIMKFIARRSADPGTGHKKKRFNEQTFKKFIKKVSNGMRVNFYELPGGKNLIAEIVK